jgi:hypothetical protein
MTILGGPTAPTPNPSLQPLSPAFFSSLRQRVISIVETPLFDAADGGFGEDSKSG